METFAELKNFVDNPHYHKQRQKALNELDIDTIDKPIIDLIKYFAMFPYCFTLQSCYGHFLYGNQKDPENIKALPNSRSIKNIEYRMAYIALCIQNSDAGLALFRELSQLPLIDPKYIQIGCSEWFWKKQVNSFALQVEPERFKTKDKVVVNYQEALIIEKVRNRFFGKLKTIAQSRVKG